MKQPALPHRIAQLRFAAKLLAVRLTLRSSLARWSMVRILESLDSSRPRSIAEPPAFALPRKLVERGLSRSGLVPDTCLYRSLARYAALRDAGVPVRFVMGVRRHEGEMLGHAWVEWRGRALDETIDPGFVVTFAHPDPERTSRRGEPVGDFA